MGDDGGSEADQVLPKSLKERIAALEAAAATSKSSGAPLNTPSVKLSASGTYQPPSQIAGVKEAKASLMKTPGVTLPSPGADLKVQGLKNQSLSMGTMSETPTTLQSAVVNQSPPLVQPKPTVSHLAAFTSQMPLQNTGDSSGSIQRSSAPTRARSASTATSRSTSSETGEMTASSPRVPLKDIIALYGTKNVDRSFMNAKTESFIDNKMEEGKRTRSMDAQGSKDALNSRYVPITPSPSSSPRSSRPSSPSLSRTAFSKDRSPLPPSLSGSSPYAVRGASPVPLDNRPSDVDSPASISSHALKMGPPPLPSSKKPSMTEYLNLSKETEDLGAGISVHQPSPSSISTQRGDSTPWKDREWSPWSPNVIPPSNSTPNLTAVESLKAASTSRNRANTSFGSSSNEGQPPPPKLPPRLRGKTVGESSVSPSLANENGIGFLKPSNSTFTVSPMSSRSTSPAPATGPPLPPPRPSKVSLTLSSAYESLSTSSVESHDRLAHPPVLSPLPALPPRPSSLSVSFYSPVIPPPSHRSSISRSMSPSFATTTSGLSPMAATGSRPSTPLTPNTVTSRDSQLLLRYPPGVSKVRPIDPRARKRYDLLWESTCSIVMLHLKQFAEIQIGGVDPGGESQLEPTTLLLNTEKEEDGAVKQQPAWILANQVKKQQRQQQQQQLIQVPGGGDYSLHGTVVRAIWERSRLSQNFLKDVWTKCDKGLKGGLTKEEFQKGMWMIDEELRNCHRQQQ